MLAWIIIFSLLGSVGALLGAALVLLLPEKFRKILVANLISYATGTLLGAVFLGLVPKALEESPSPGILVFWDSLLQVALILGGIATIRLLHAGN